MNRMTIKKSCILIVGKDGSTCVSFFIFFIIIIGIILIRSHIVQSDR